MIKAFPLPFDCINFGHILFYQFLFTITIMLILDVAIGGNAPAVAGIMFWLFTFCWWMWSMTQGPLCDPVKN